MPEIEIKDKSPIDKAWAILTVAGLEDSLKNRQNLNITTKGLGRLERDGDILDVKDKLMTGISGRSSVKITLPLTNVRLPDNPQNGNYFAWTIRWDWDEKKGEHVNATFTGSTTVKYAILPTNPKTSQDLYTSALSTLTRNAGYEYSMRFDQSKRQEWAANGIRKWLCQAELRTL